MNRTYETAPTLFDGCSNLCAPDVRDVGSAPLLAVVLVLPVALSVPSIRRGSRLAWLAPLGLVAELAAWFGYYTSGAPNPGLGAGLGVAVGGSAIGLTAAVVALVLTRRQSSAGHPQLSKTTS